MQFMSVIIIIYLFFLSSKEWTCYLNTDSWTMCLALLALSLFSCDLEIFLKTFLKKMHCVTTRTLPLLILFLLLPFRSYYIRAKGIHFMLKGFLQSFSLKSLPKQVHLNTAKL